MSSDKKPVSAGASGLFEKDAVSKALGIEIIETGSEHAQCKMTVKEDMLNGLGLCHGGVLFSLADSTAAFAMASGGDTGAMTFEGAIHFFSPARERMILFSTATAVKAGKTLKRFEVLIHDKENTLIAKAFFTGLSK